MSNFCRHCGSPSWRNGPCWWHAQYAERMRRDGYDEANIDAFWKSGSDAPCQGDHYDEGMRELGRRNVLAWLLFGGLPFCAVVFALYLIL